VPKRHWLGVVNARRCRVHPAGASWRHLLFRKATHPPARGRRNAQVATDGTTARWVVHADAGTGPLVRRSAPERCLGRHRDIRQPRPWLGSVACRKSSSRRTRNLGFATVTSRRDSSSSLPMSASARRTARAPSSADRQEVRVGHTTSTRELLVLWERVRAQQPPCSRSPDRRVEATLCSRAAPSVPGSTRLAILPTPTPSVSASDCQGRRRFLEAKSPRLANDD
jgi:hypothetical protein